MMLIGGIVSCLVGLILVASCIGLIWPGTYLSVVTGILCIIKASALLGERAYRESRPTAPAIMQTSEARATLRSVFRSPVARIALTWASPQAARYSCISR